MIGNWLSVYVTNGTPEGWTEFAIRPYNINTIRDYPEWFKGIPLTEEWLLKFGLEERYVKNEWSWHLNKWNSYTEIRKTEGGFKFLDGYPEIKYVHQLQNIYFALTGEELMLK